ncbi:MAG: BadF/BadG/BcrA/BcrD ATPase family protein [Bryobacteraceae bacterium]
MTHPQAKLYLGVDGGQTSTVALIADETGKVLGRGKGGPCNHVGPAQGRARFFSALGDSLDQACAQAGVSRHDVSFVSACLGFSGGPQDKDAFVRELIRSDHYRITHDAEIALEGATGGLPGVIVIAGTGSMAYGKNEEGKTARAGGWGYAFGDEGGAFFLARQVLRAALAFEEGWGQPTQLYNKLLDAANAMSADEILRRFYAGQQRSVIASYASLLDEAERADDGVARLILVEGAGELAKYAHHVHRRLFPSLESVEIAYVGGVFQSELLRTVFIERMRMAIGSVAHRPKLSPAAGALLRALRDTCVMAPLSNVPESET